MSLGPRRWADFGSIVSLSDLEPEFEAREYNDAGELTATTNALGERTEFTYDALGRMLTKTTRAGTPAGETTTFVLQLLPRRHDLRRHQRQVHGDLVLYL